jgi:hypothetical protein
VACVVSGSGKFAAPPHGSYRPAYTPSLRVTSRGMAAWQRLAV